MTLRAAQKRSLPDDVFAQLLDAILSGAYSPGDTIPSERELSAVLAVNRHVVREAIKRLEQIGVLRVTQGGRTKVLDYRLTAGLDLLALAAERSPASAEHLPLLVSSLEMRAGIGADVARLCAERAGAQAGPRLLDLAEQLSCAPSDELVDLDERFWQEILDGAGNLAYQLAFNSLMRAVHAQRELSQPWIEHELAQSDYRKPIAIAIAARDTDGAAQAARDALDPTERVSALARDAVPKKRR